MEYEPEIAYIDADVAVYAAAFSAQKTKYYFQKEGKQVSQLFNSAKLAKAYLNELATEAEMFEEEPEVTLADRVSTIAYGTEKEAIKHADNLIKDFKDLVGKSVKKYVFGLTPRGEKSRVDETTEVKYQINRENAIKPKHYEAVRTYLENHPEFKIAPKGAEADEWLIACAEKHGYKAVLASCDKDLATCQNTWFIHMSKMFTGTPKAVDTLGELWLDSKGKVRGVGWLWLCVQGLSGDQADSVKGLGGIGEKTAYNLLKDCTTVGGATQICLDFYRKEVGGIYVYKSWAGLDMQVTPEELMNQQFNLVYMRRSSTDKFDYKNYL